MHPELSLDEARCQPAEVELHGNRYIKRKSAPKASLSSDPTLACKS
ncbi:minor tail protein [Salmonella phage 21]|nr:minor tail protein [Salmonella phage 21]